jgi:uncharacterized membrane-anchored protein YjiN (DUF445 family)
MKRTACALLAVRFDSRGRIRPTSHQGRSGTKSTINAIVAGCGRVISSTPAIKRAIMPPEQDASPAPPHREFRPPDAELRDVLRRRRLTRNRLLATGLLAAMATIYVATYAIAEPATWLLLIRAGAEAGIVGGLADWFAVTALFRHPLGLPIPHTAIVPNNKERIGATLSHFVEQNFLTRVVLLRKLRDAELGPRLTTWLATPQTAHLLANWATQLLPQLIRAVENPELHELLDRSLGNELRRVDLAPLLGRLIEIITHSGEADALFESLLVAAARWLAENDPLILEMVETRSRWWVPKPINRRIAKAVLDGLTDLLTELRDSRSETRRMVRTDLSRFLQDMAQSPEQREKINQAKERLLTHPQLKAWVETLWKDLSETVLRDLASPSPKSRAALEQGIGSIARALADDATMLARINSGIERLALALVVKRREIASVIEEVVHRWDARTLSERLELVVGSDLQYIRMNGTLVGAGVGALIFIASHLFRLQ